MKCRKLKKLFCFKVINWLGIPKWKIVCTQRSVVKINLCTRIDDTICHYGNVSLHASEISDSMVEFQGTYCEVGTDCS
jgi:hypothetical protein